MYETYWQLAQKPFEGGWDPRLYYPSEVHQGALLKLRYGVENRRGAVLLAGAAGLGKSLLIEALGQQLGDEFAPLVRLVYPQMPTDQLLAYLADELGAGAPDSAAPTVQQSVRRIAHVLNQAGRHGQHAVVVIDEAHLLRSGDALEALRLLLNFEVDARPGLTMLLVGQPALLPMLDRMPALEQRIGVKCLLRPLVLEETVSYVSHRLTAAGATRAIFDSAALEAVHHLTHGVPRQINRLCDLALLIGFAEEQPAVTAAQVEAVSSELVTVAPD
jgi:general secretion pathway protein A